MLLVTGGFLGGFKEDLITTEIFVSGASSWIEVVGGDLPMPSQGISGVSFQNQILMMGKNLLNYEENNSVIFETGGWYNSDNNYGSTSNLVLNFNTSNQTWDMLGNMMSSRVYHDLSLVPVMTIMDFCKYIFMVNWVVYLCEVQRGKTSKFTQ